MKTKYGFATSDGEIGELWASGDESARERLKKEFPDSTVKLYRGLSAEQVNELYGAATAKQAIADKDAELARLRAALDAANAERDAAVNVAKVLVHSEGSINIGGTIIKETEAGYIVSNAAGSGTYSLSQFDAAWGSFVRNSAHPAAPAPTAQPAAVEAEACNHHLVNAQQWLDSDIHGKDTIAIRQAVQSLILHMQKGESQS